MDSTEIVTGVVTTKCDNMKTGGAATSGSSSSGLSSGDASNIQTQHHVSQGDSNKAIASTKTQVKSSSPASGSPSQSIISRQDSGQGETAKRRSSSRSIKRKKFDDELVESSISYQKITRGRNSSISGVPGSVTPGSAGGKSGSTSPIPVLTAAASGLSLAVDTTAPEMAGGGKSRGSGGVGSSIGLTSQGTLSSSLTSSSSSRVAPTSVTSTTSRKRRHRNVHNTAIKDIGRWKPQDDLSLVLGVQQTNDLDAVFRGVKFSCRFSLKEIEDRWYALLYDPVIAKIGVSAMRQLHPDIIAQVHDRALFSEAEEELLRTIPSTTVSTVETFEELLVKHPQVFIPHRSSKGLYNHWSLMKHYHLLPDQTLQPLPRHEDVVTFSDAEEMIERETQAALQTGQIQRQSSSSTSQSTSGLPGVSSRLEADVLNHELTLADRKAKREIRHLENEIPKWQVLVDSITGVAPSDFDNQTLAVLRGRLVRYLMRSREITLGRSTKDSVVDVDLSLEGPSFKISRRQGLIKLQPNGDFMIANTGKRPLYVDSKPVLGSGNCAKLNNNSVVEISGLRFVFLINMDLIAGVRADSLKSQL